ncbi:MrcB family domain-containing protein [Cytobacillus firmus]|uniref:DUF3578 domain-containing protein n=1 Tax=Cytobacillus firmus TaxID=1399 RepID=A0AA46P796_CYTFI|nr:DUF3578 domain-containing protein [Cytobacillus firmus]UYG96754.1 DUF3578 domain-containing protein [Cytobacillus firmus]
MRKSFLRILNDYIEMYNSPYKPTEHSLAGYIKNDFPSLIFEQLSLDTTMYTIEGSVGAGGWTGTPWISVFDKDITKTAQKGFYIVYLFRQDMKGVYLSLNQGTKYIKNKYNGQKPKDKMKTIAANIRKSLIYDVSQFPLDRIDLATSTDNGNNYMAAHICGKYYTASNIPNNDELIADLKEMLQIYLQLKSLMAGKTIEEMLDFYLQKEEIEDIQFQNDILVAPATRTAKEPQPIPTQATTYGRQRWKRNPSIAKEALQKVNYLCEFEASHVTFKSQVTNENFVEAHHLVPIKIQNEFSWSLDVPGNIVSLCPNCHRKIHHATKKERRLILKSLFEKRRNELSDYGILISIERLYKSYEC